MYAAGVLNIITNSAAIQSEYSVHPVRQGIIGTK